MEQLFISIFVLVLEIVSKGSVHGSGAVMQKFSQQHALDGYIPTITFSATFYARSLTECGIRCASNSTCTSFFYTAVDNACQLEDIVHSNTTTGLQNSTSTVYFVSDLFYAMPFSCPTDDLQFRTVLLGDSTAVTYRVFKTKRTYTEAALECSNFGGHLLQILTDARTTFTTNLLMCTGYFGIGDYWFDGTNTAASDFNDLNQWVTSDGQVLPTSFWYSGQPNTPTVDHCVALYEAFSFGWSDRLCTYVNNYICEL